MTLPKRVVIPEPIKRQVRQMDFFGCCHCGSPFFQYHHIIERSEDPNEIMLICNEFHDKFTKKVIPIKEQWELKKNPYNKKKGYVKGLLRVNQNFPFIRCGSVEFVGDKSFLRTNHDENLLSIRIEDETLLLSVNLYDKNDNKVLEIKDNEWITGNEIPWDIEPDYQKIKLRQKKGDITLEINATKLPLQFRGKFYRFGKLVVIDQSNFKFYNSPADNPTTPPEELEVHFTFAEHCYVGVSFVITQGRNGLTMIPDTRFFTGATIIPFKNFSNPKKRLRKAWKDWDDRMKFLHQKSKTKILDSG